MRCLSKWRWWAATLLFIVIVVASEVKQPAVQQVIHRVVYSSEDLIFVRTALQQLFLRSEQIPVSTQVSTEELLTFVSMERFNDGILLTYDQPIAVQAFFDGLIIFTSYTKDTGKTLTVLYSEGTTVTYGFIDELMRLPYTSLSAGEVIVQKQPGSLYIQVERNGAILNMEETVAWLKEHRT